MRGSKGAYVKKLIETFSRTVFLLAWANLKPHRLAQSIRHSLKYIIQHELDVSDLL